MDRSWRRRRPLATILCLGLLVGCAHNREVIYPQGHDGLVTYRAGRGGHTRAPKVDVNVPIRIDDPAPRPGMGN